MVPVFSVFEKSVARFFTPEDRPERFRAVDGLRGFAILLVFLHHFNANFRFYAAEGTFSEFTSHTLWAVGRMGMGTMLFSVLVGFFTYRTLISGSVAVKQFFMRRLLRIYPCFFVLFVIYASLSFVFPKERIIPQGASRAFIYLFQNLLLLPGIFPIEPLIVVTWFLSYLIFFTAGAVIIVRCLRMRYWSAQQRLVFLGCTLICFFAYNLLVRDFRPQLAGFLVGALLFDLMAVFPAPRNLRLTTKTIAGIALVAGPMLQYALNEGYAPVEALNILAIREPLRVVLISLWAALFCFIVMTSKGWLSRSLSIRPLYWLGVISYSFYLTHWLCLKGVAYFSKAAIAPTGSQSLLFWLALPGTLLLSWVCSAILYHWVEMPFSLRPGSPLRKDE